MKGTTQHIVDIPLRKFRHVYGTPRLYFFGDGLEGAG